MKSNEPGMLAGIPDIDRFADQVRSAGQHLIGFAGPENYHDTFLGGLNEPAPGAAAEVSFGGGDEQFVMNIRRLEAAAPEGGGPASWGDPGMDGLEARLRAVLAASGVAPADQSSVLHALASGADRAAVAGDAGSS